MEFLGFLFVIAILVAVIAAAVAYLRIMLKPMRRVETNVRPASQFVLADIFWLMLLVQACLGATSFMAKAWYWNQTITIIVGGYLLLSTGILWWRSVGTLTALGICHAGRRAVFLVLVAPMAAVGAVATPGVIIVAFVALFNGEPLYMLMLPALALTCFVGRLLTAWVLAGMESMPTGDEDVLAETPSAVPGER